MHVSVERGLSKGSGLLRQFATVGDGGSKNMTIGFDLEPA